VQGITQVPLLTPTLPDSQQKPLELQVPLQHGVPPVLQPLPFGMHIGVVEVEVVLVEVEVLVVLLVVVVVVCAWQLPLEQLPLQHCSFLVQFLPLRLQPGGSAEASPMPSDPSVLPMMAAPINLSALRREMLPLASPLARSSKDRSLASGDIGYPFPKRRDSSAPPCQST
jgi:hypothetical protein